MIDILNAAFLLFCMYPKRQQFLERILKHLAPNMRKKKLVGMCKTRRVERRTCCDMFYDMYEFLCEYLEAVLNPSEYHDIYEEVALTGSWDQETRTKAQGLLTSLPSSHTIIAFIITKNVLENVRPMTSKLQKRDLDIYQAYSMIDQTRERMITMRQDIEEEYSVWYKDATCLVILLGTSIMAPGTTRSSRQMQRVNVSITSPREHYLRNLAIQFCDHLSAEFHNRFNPQSRKGIEILALLPGIITETRNVQHVVDGQKCQTCLHRGERMSALLETHRAHTVIVLA